MLPIVGRSAPVVVLATVFMAYGPAPSQSPPPTSPLPGTAAPNAASPARTFHHQRRPYPFPGHVGFRLEPTTGVKSGVTHVLDVDPRAFWSHQMRIADTWNQYTWSEYMAYIISHPAPGAKSLEAAYATYVRDFDTRDLRAYSQLLAPGYPNRSGALALFRTVTEGPSTWAWSVRIEQLFTHPGHMTAWISQTASRDGMTMTWYWRHAWVKTPAGWQIARQHRIKRLPSPPSV
jgi:hypothetical protein